MKESKRYFAVALNGDGGDENFAGYRRYKVMKFFNLLKHIPGKKISSRVFLKLYNLFKTKDFANLSRILSLPYSDHRYFYSYLISFIDSNSKNSLLTLDFKAKVKNSNNNFVSKYFNKVNNLDLMDQLLSVDINTYLPEVLLAKTDITSMAQSLEVRSPFLDHEFMELIAKMPINLKLNGLNSKFILKKIAGKYLPEECFKRKKQGFIPPLDIWFRGKLHNYMKEQLLSEKFTTLDIFKKEEIERLITEHEEYKRDNSYTLWTILCLNQWSNVWFKE